MKILVARIIGNDLTPRHAEGAQLQALKFIVDNEVVPTGVDRLFVVNRIKNPSAEAEIIEYLEGMDLKYWVVRHGDGEPCGDKIELNHVRNNIISYAREQFYHWCFPLDGRCYIPEKAYKEMKTQCAAYAERHYAFMPQHRVLHYADVHNDLRGDFYAFSEKRPNGAIIRNEYALGFSIHAMAKFNEALKYGQVDKAEMLLVAGIPGPWLNWVAEADSQGIPVRGEVAAADFQAARPAQYSGWCLVLPSGNLQADSDIEVRARLREESLKNLA